MTNSKVAYIEDERAESTLNEQKHIRIIVEYRYAIRNM